ncbi:FecCD family ABC transporter permease [Paenibacillus physcomitrellae]|uniref:Iron ABC transporter permease n=1 Tax=Paenibacillus physcomitrellae TaxID=1619311 RepID=A0ABQ1FYM2_9BACL|nr:iron ABC transporter permease [Paenibacillus physcomitrellae]GGA33144.1 iron ABC transporter permease [Paenibacillus physcomitrellae]
MLLPSNGNRGARAKRFGLLLLLAVIVVFVISVNTGTIRLSPRQLGLTLLGYGSPQDQLVLFTYRLPRIVVTLLAGAGLGVAGAVLQGVSRNALADPGILGLHAGAAFGLMIFVSFFRTLEGPSALIIPLFTFAGGLLIALMVVGLAYDRHKGLVPIRLILVGIAIEAGFSAVTLFLGLRLDPDTYAFAASWLAGSVWGRDWINVLALLPWIALLLPYVYARSKMLDVFTLGDDTAVSIGGKVTQNRLILLAAAVALSCASVSMAGGIGFIGLLAPHIARRLAGPMHRHSLPLSALTGMLILLAADTVGRSIFAPNAVPAGVVVAVIGAPLFFTLLMRSK